MAKPNTYPLPHRLLTAVATLAVALLAAGCRNLDNAQVDVLERELRAQEDYIYELEDYLVEYSEKLRQARLAQGPSASGKKATKLTPAGRRSAGEPTLDIDRPAAPLPTPAASSRVRSPLTEAPPAGPEAEDALEEAPPAETPAAEPESIDPYEMDVPELEIGPGANAAPQDDANSFADAPALAPPLGGVEPLIIPDPIDYQAADEPLPAPELAAAPAAEPEQIAEPELAAPQLAAPQLSPPRLTAERLQIRRVFGEPASDDDPSLAKLLVVVEALSGANEPVGAEGEVSMMIMAQDAPNSFQRIDRWDFSPQETAAAWQSSQLGDGLHLELPLHASGLPAGELQLWARVVTPDGRKLLTQVPLDPHQLASLDEATPEPTVLAASEALIPVDGDPAAKPLSTSTIAATPPAPAKPAPQWRAAATPIEPTTAESLVSAAADMPVTEPRVAQASTAEPPKSQWKRSTSAAASETPPAWSPNR